MFIQEAIATERRRELLAQARDRRLASRLSALGRARRRAGRAQRRLSQARLAAIQLRGSLQAEQDL